MFLSHAHVGLIEHRIRYSIHWSVIHVLFNTHLCAITSISTVTDFSPWCRIQDDLAGLTIQFATSLKICTCLNHRKSIHPIESMATRRPKSRVCRSGPAWMRCKWSSARRSWRKAPMGNQEETQGKTWFKPWGTPRFHGLNKLRTCWEHVKTWWFDVVCRLS